MKRVFKAMAIMVLILAAASLCICLVTLPIRMASQEEPPKKKKRIRLVEATVLDHTGMQIIEVDGIEYLVSGRGGIQQLSPAKEVRP